MAAGICRLVPSKEELGVGTEGWVAESGFQLLNRGQAGVEGLRQGTDELVFGYAHRLVYARERVFSDEPFLCPAEKESDGGLVVRCLDLGVHGGEVEVQLSGVFRLEGGGLQFDDNVAFQARVVENQIDKELFAIDHQSVLASNEGEACAEFQQEAGNVADEGILDVAFLGFFARPRKSKW